ncbi:MAG: MATE family efflux transporter [Candidatus Eiseniibacteriota bacterium]|jgi:MATE family multidrug resistance protein
MPETRTDTSATTALPRQPLRGEIRAVLALAAPVAMVQLGMMAMGTVDAMMLGRVSELALAAGALGASLTFGLLCFPMGVLMALDPLVAQAVGAGDRDGVATHVKQAALVALLLCVPLALILWDTRPALRLFGQQPEVIELTSGYLRAMIPGLPAFLFFVVLRRTIQAMSVLTPAFIAILVGNLFNAAGNWILIYGNLGAPALGVVGSAYATAISRWSSVVMLAVLAAPTLEPYGDALRAARIRLASLRRQVAIGLPIGAHIALEMWTFGAVALLMGHLGARELAGHQIALNLAAIAFMFPLGVSGAASTRVGNAIGRRDMPGARRAAAVCLCLGGGIMTVSALAFWLAPELLSRLYTPDVDVIRMAAALLPIAAIFQVCDGIQVVGSGVLRGAADTRVPAAIAFVGFWLLGLPLAALLAFRQGMGPQGLWWGLTLGLSVVAALLVARIVRRFRGEIAAVVTVPVRPGAPAQMEIGAPAILPGTGSPSTAALPGEES